MRKEFIVNRQGKDYCLYAGLLDEAHRQGLKRIHTTLIQAPNEANGQLAICHAIVETEKGSFEGIGDASPENVGRMVAMHTTRMAETRAKARALRDAINVGTTALEELGDLEDHIGQPRHVRADQSPDQPRAETSKSPRRDNDRPSAEQITRLRKLEHLTGQAESDLHDATAILIGNRIAALVRQANQNRGNR